MKTKALVLAGLLAAGIAVPAAAQDRPLPADGRMVNVRAAPFNAAGNGTTDDTQAIQAAIAFALNNSNRYGAPREHNANRALALRHLDHDGYRNTAAGAAGKLFVEDVIGKPYLISGAQHVWTRQLNAEFGAAPLVENLGGTLWVLGLKTEGEMTCVKTVGGSTEVLGALLYPLSQNVTEPAFINDEGRVSLSFTKAGPYYYPVYVRERRGGVWREFTIANLGARGLPLFTGYGAAPLAAAPAPTTPDDLTAYPNPCGPQLTVALRAPAAGRAQVRVLDALGRACFSADRPAAPGPNRWLLALGTLAPGLYVLEVQLNSQTSRQRLVVE